jgi:adenylate cyclase
LKAADDEEHRRSTPREPVGPWLEQRPELEAPVHEYEQRPEQEFFADGISEDVITALSRYPSLFVIARNSYTLPTTSSSPGASKSAATTVLA